MLIFHRKTIYTFCVHISLTRFQIAYLPGVQTLNLKGPIIHNNCFLHLLPSASPWYNFNAYKISDNKVVVFNTSKIVYSGNKLEAKIYYHFSGYPGGVKEITLKKLVAENPNLPLKKAVRDMLPKNTLRDKTMKNLKLYEKEIE